MEIGEITGASSGAINPVYKYILKMRITDAPSAAVNPVLLKLKKYEVTGSPPRTVNPVFVFFFLVEKEEITAASSGAVLEILSPPIHNCRCLKHWVHLVVLLIKDVVQMHSFMQIILFYWILGYKFSIRCTLRCCNQCSHRHNEKGALSGAVNPIYRTYMKIINDNYRCTL